MIAAVMAVATLVQAQGGFFVYRRPRGTSQDCKLTTWMSPPVAGDLNAAADGVGRGLQVVLMSVNHTTLEQPHVQSWWRTEGAVLVARSAY
jgi:hypothetical protein